VPDRPRTFRTWAAFVRGVRSTGRRGPAQALAAVLLLQQFGVVVRRVAPAPWTRRRVGVGAVLHRAQLRPRRPSTRNRMLPSG